MSKVTFHDPPGAEKNSEAFHYSQVVKIGNVLRTSGQGGWDADGNILPDLQAQVDQAFENVITVLRSAHSTATWSNVVSVRSYHVNMTESFDAVTNAFKRLDPNLKPVWTCVEVSKLGIEGMKIEVEVEAVV